MESIIHQVMCKMEAEILKCVVEDGIRNIGQCSKDLLVICKERINELLASFAEEVDKEVYSSKAQRKTQGLVVQERHVPRSVLLHTGILKYRRTYYKNKEGGYAYPVDHLIGVEESSRMSREIEAELVETATHYSFAKSSAIVTGGELSRQTVHNKVGRVGEVAYIPEKRKETPKELHIFADEDHVAMQDGKNTIVKLVTVSEGIEAICKNRNALRHPLHFEGYQKKPEVLWEYVYAVLHDIYDLAQVEKIWIHGDGAAWIKTASDYFTDATHVLDTYHLNKYKKKLTAHLSGHLLGQYTQKIQRALKEDSPEHFEEAVSGIYAHLHEIFKDEAGKKQQNLLKAAQYIRSNWSKIQARYNETTVGSCTEGMVSHVLSERLSRNPMGWSSFGLGKMAMLRVYTQNGQHIDPSDVRLDRPLKGTGAKDVFRKIKTYEALVDKMMQDASTGTKDWDMMNTGHYRSGKKTGTAVLIKSMAQQTLTKNWRFA